MGTPPTAFCQSCGQPLASASRFCNHCGQPQPSAEPVGGASSAAAAPAFTPPSSTAYVAAPAMPYAGFWIRFIAVVIDGLVVGVVTGPIMIVLQVAAGLSGGFNVGDKPEIRPEQIAMLAGVVALIVTINIAINACYEALLMASKKQATVGKMVFRIKVTDANGNRLSVARAFGRHFAKYVSGFTFGIGYIIQAFTERRQALHDMIAGTLVVRDVSPPYPIVPPQTIPPTAQP